jgi:hypothetical protein
MYFTPENSKRVTRLGDIGLCPNCAHFRAVEPIDEAMKVPVAQVRIDFRGLAGLVAKEKLDRSEIPSQHDQVAGKRMPPGTQRRILNSQSLQPVTEPHLKREHGFVKFFATGYLEAAR